MDVFIKILIGFIALQHFGFLILEMFFWSKPVGQKIFKTTPDFAKQSATLAANQGLYNGFLSAGLIWSLLAQNSMSQSLMVFFVSCVFVAGLYGWYSVNRTILYVQALPAALTLVLIGLQSI